MRVKKPNNIYMAILILFFKKKEGRRIVDQADLLTVGDVIIESVRKNDSTIVSV